MTLCFLRKFSAHPSHPNTLHAPKPISYPELAIRLFAKGTTIKAPLSILFATALALQPTTHAIAQMDMDHVHTQEKLGSVSFTTSCSPAVQVPFNRAVALMHSFQLADAIKAFQGVLATDPACAMADWGIALSDWGNPFAAGIKPPAQLEKGLAAVDAARTAKPSTERERAYVEAVAKLFTDPAHNPQRTRVLAYESAMASVSAAYPQDLEASIFYALAIAAAADPTDKTYARQLKSGEMLEALYANHPDHPGLAHYIIHAYDVPPLAARAAVAAERYSKIAPAAPHALHMPSHTFTRLGEWQQSIDANIASAAAAKAAGQPGEEMHASDYMVYAYLQTGQDKAARQVLETATQIFNRLVAEAATPGATSPGAVAFPHAAIPARYALERHQWADAAKLEFTPGPSPQSDAITFFAQGMGAAHLKDHAAAAVAIDSLKRSREKLIDAKETYWANQVDIQAREVAAWLAFADGKPQEALAGLREAAAMEDDTEKSVVTPGPLAPARELLGELLLELKRPAEAAKEFQATLLKEPNRFWSLYGVAEAAKRSGDHPTERLYFQKLLKVAARADQPGRPQLAEARLATK